MIIPVSIAFCGQKAGCWDTPNRKGFRNIPDKCRGIRAAMLAGRQYSVSAGNRLKRRNPSGVHNRTRPKRDSTMYPAVITILRLVGGLMRMMRSPMLEEILEAIIYFHIALISR